MKTIYLAFICSVLSLSAFSQDPPDSVKMDSAYLKLIEGRFYNTDPCGGCPERFSPDHKPKMFMDNPYKYKSNKPIMINLPDSLKNKWLKKYTLFKEKPLV